MLCNAGVLPKTRKISEQWAPRQLPTGDTEICGLRQHFYKGAPKKKPHSDFGQWDPEHSERSRDGGKKKA